jgi:uncharacterized protein (TIGR03083 family)
LSDEDHAASSTLARIRRRMKEEGEKTAAYFDTLADADWDQQVYTTGSGWRVRQLLAHFISAERTFERFIRDVLSGGSGAPQDFDIDAFNESEVPELAAPPPELIEAYRAARLRTLKLLEEISSTDLGLRGYHPWFGDSQLEDMLKLIYRHNIIHLRDIRRALNSGAPVPHLDVMPPASVNTGAVE